MKKILVVGQTPPPYGGQAMMTERLLKKEFKDLRIYHVRMAFSDSMASVGKASIRKIFHLFSVIGQTLLARYRYGVDTLYYMPVGNDMTPLVRDIGILLLIRRFFAKTIFHFRAAGTSEFVDRQRPLLKQLAMASHRKPDLAIQLSGRNPRDGDYFRAARTVVVWDGLEDAAQPYLPLRRMPGPVIRILYVGVVRETKGIWVLLEAMRILQQKQYAVRLEVVGDFSPAGLEQEVRHYCREHHLEETVHFAGVQTGDDKWQYYKEADIFCFPSFFESESFGNVVVEAMMFELPVVATRWRGIPDVVAEGQTGLLVPVKDPAATATALEQLVTDADLRTRMGKAGRQRFMEHFQLEQFLARMDEQLTQV